MNQLLGSVDLQTDGHVHTRLCHHATGEMEEYVLAAIDRGLRRIVFLEHLETGIVCKRSTWLSEADFDYYFAQGERLRRKYRGRIQVETGVELGYNAERREEILARIGSRPWARIGISCHFLRFADTDDHLNLLSKHQEYRREAQRIGCERILDRYFDSLIEAVRLLPGSVLCHLDAALRYVPGIRFSPHHHRQIDQLLVEVKARGMALEINTSGIAIRGEPFPARGILARAIELGIPLAVGSDAHRPEDVGNHFATLPDYLLSLQK